MNYKTKSVSNQDPREVIRNYGRDLKALIESEIGIRLVDSYRRRLFNGDSFGDGEYYTIRRLMPHTPFLSRFFGEKVAWITYYEHPILGAGQHVIINPNAYPNLQDIIKHAVAELNEKYGITLRPKIKK